MIKYEKAVAVDSTECKAVYQRDQLVNFCDREEMLNVVGPRIGGSFKGKGLFIVEQGAKWELVRDEKGCLVLIGIRK